MPHGRARRENADLLRPRNGAHAVPADHLAHLDHRLSHVAHERAAGRFCMGEGFAEQLFRHGVDLHRVDDALEAAGGIAVELIQQFLRPLETGFAGGLVPAPRHVGGRSHAPAARGEARRAINAHAARAHRVDPALEGYREVADGRDAGGQHLGVGEHLPRPAALRRRLEGLRALVQSRHPLLGYAVVFADATIAGFRRRMGMDVDETWDQEMVGGVDHLRAGRRGDGPARGDLGDPARFEPNVHPAAVDVPPTFQHDRPGRVADERRLN